MKVKSLSNARLLATPWTAADQAPLSMGFSRQEYWSGVPLPSPKLGLAPIIDQEGGAFVSHEVFTPVLGFFLCSPFVGFSPFFVCLLAAMILDSFFYSNYLTASPTQST